MPLALLNVKADLADDAAQAAMMMECPLSEAEKIVKMTHGCNS